jgi:hypothetical protein
MMGATTSGGQPGAVQLFISGNPPSLLGSDLMYGGAVSSGSMSNIYSLMSLGFSHGVGSFTTTPIPAAGFFDAFTKIMQAVDNMFLDSAQLVIKYSTAPRYGFPVQYTKDLSARSTWVTTSSFTIDSTKKDFSQVQVGDEIDIIEGAAAGYTAHITAIDTSTSTYSITIDEVLPVSAGQKSEMSVDNWKKLIVATSNNSNFIEKQVAETLIPELKGGYVQLKVEIRGIQPAVRKLSVINSVAKANE